MANEILAETRAASPATGRGSAPSMSARGEFAARWPILLAGFIGMLTGAWAFPIFILGPLVQPLEDEFGWSRGAIVLCQTFLSLGMVFGTPMAGRLADRFGVRRVSLISMLLLVCLFSSMTIIRHTWHLQLIYLLIGMLGAGSGAVTYTRAIGGWFQAGRGLALGLILSATGMASFLSPNLIESLTEWHGWRTACLGVAGLTLFMGIPIVYFLLREPPADISRPVMTERPLVPVSRKAAFGDPRFWVLIASVTGLGLFFSGLIVHLIPMLIDNGVSAATAAQIASISGLAMVVGRLSAGFLLDRIKAAHVGAAMFLLGATGTALYVLFGAPAAIFSVAAIGILIGAEMDLVSYIVLHYFGLRSYGVLFGILVGFYSGSGMLSPFVAEALVSVGGYSTLYICAALAFGTIAVLFMLLGALHRPTEPQPVSAGAL